MKDIQGQFNVASSALGAHTSFQFPGACNNGGASGSCWETIVSDPVTVTHVPEPSSLSIIGAGLAMLGASTWFRKKRKVKAAV